MEIKLTPEEKLQFYYDALCNGYGCLRDCDIQLDVKDAEYDKSYENLKQFKPVKEICFEDVLIQMLKDGYKLKFVDPYHPKGVSVDLETVYTNIEKTPLKHLLDMVNESGDGITAFAILQSVMYGELVFG